MKLLYKPFSLIAGFIAARIGRNVFKTVWAKIDRAEPPDPKTAEATLPKSAGAAALEAATMAGVAAAAEHASARFFHHLFGAWPVKHKQPDEES